MALWNGVRFRYTAAMDSHAAPPGLLTIDEYLAFEETSPVRHEYVGGTLYALAGGSDRHNRIAGNIYVTLWGNVRDSCCRVYMTDMKLQVDRVFYYPDVMVCCEEPETENPVFRTDPCLLIEVLSPGTAAKDRREKLIVYSGIPSLRAYLLVDQDAQHVERRFRDADGVWQRADHISGGSVPLPCPETRLSLDDIYRGL